MDQIVLTTTTTKFSEIKTLKPMLLPSVKSKLMNKLTVKHAVTNKDQIQKLKKAIIKNVSFSVKLKKHNSESHECKELISIQWMHPGTWNT